MKNMMLQGRNSNLLRALSVCVLCSVFCVLTSCEKKGQPVDPYVDPGTTENPQWKITVDTTDMTASMTAIVRVSFAKSEGTLAAFMGEDCCGIAEYTDSLYWLFISPSTTANAVRLKFYSPDLKRIFVAKETFPFVNDDHKGSCEQPFTPTWEVAQ